jgi:hypothetical protein
MTGTEKRTFLLDKNVFLHAIHRVDRFNKEDDTALKLITRIVRQCDVIMLPRILLSFLSKAVDELKVKLSLTYEGNKLLEVLKYCLQFPKCDIRLEETEGITIPCESECPNEDVGMAKVIIGYQPQIFVSADPEFLEYLKRKSVAPRVDVLGTKEALEKCHGEPET